MICENCKGPLGHLSRIDLRRFCKKQCRWQAAYQRRKARFAAWRAAGRALKWADLEYELIARAPRGAAFFVLTCVDVKSVSWSFPQNGGFRLRTYEAPTVPVKGEYQLTYLSFDFDEPTPAGTIAIGFAEPGLRMRDGARHRFRPA